MVQICYNEDSQSDMFHRYDREEDYPECKPPRFGRVEEVDGELTVVFELRQLHNAPEGYEECSKCFEEHPQEATREELVGQIRQEIALNIADSNGILSKDELREVLRAVRE